MDFGKLKKEYLKGGTSYRKLAEKYNVPFGTLRKVAAKEHWRELRDKTRAKTDIKTIEIISDSEADRAKRILTASDSLLEKIERSIEAFDVLDGKTAQGFAGALKSIRDIQGIRNPLDIKEQEARIAKLEKEAKSDEEDNEFIIRMEGVDPEWLK
ncbi:MAG: hypothetical protein IJ306_01135 [Oscillospiraceae bacterium]|nr:hypothetical protein [Oscillospiraceae bacterium]